jgi:S1-C subfamily serine protease
MASQGNLASAIRLLAIGLIIGMAAWWAGARWGDRQPARVEAVPTLQSRGGSNADLTPDEAVNVSVYKQASSAVANIVTRTITYDFFMGPVPSEGAGSGFVIDDKGHVLTNFHVVQGAQRIEVTLGDRSTYVAKFVGGDPRNDVALLKIEPKNGKLNSLPLGDSSTLQVGQRVLAIGNPFGRFQSTLTTGVVSALGRTVQTGDQTFIDEAIQTDAAINRGNSGGPLLNTHGQVIGINSAIFTPSGTTAGIGFAIPVNTAKRIVNDLLTAGRVRQAYLGIEGTSVWPQLSQALDLPADEGILIERVQPGGPAANAGIRGGNRAVVAGLMRLVIGGDLLVAIDGQKVAQNLDVNVLLNRKRPGDVVTLTIYRGNSKMDVKATLGDR